MLGDIRYRMRSNISILSYLYVRRRHQHTRGASVTSANNCASCLKIFDKSQAFCKDDAENFNKKSLEKFDSGDSPVLQFELSLYFFDRHITTTAAFSTAIAIASRIDPAEIRHYYFLSLV